MSKKHLIPVITFLIIFSCIKTSSGLKKSDIPLLVNQFLAMHVRYHTLDNELSGRILDNLVISLDYGKYYFYKKDIDGFNKYRDKIDDYVSNGQLSFISEIFSVYKKRFEESRKIVRELIKGKFDFNADETIMIDRDKVDYAITKEEMRERWRKNIKLQLLNYLASNSDIDEAKKKLIKKYDLLEKRINELDEDRQLDRFMNAFSTALDPHSNYLSQDEHEDFNISMKLKLEGIGVRLRSEDGFVIVESIIAGGAADKLPEKIKLKPGDKIISVAQVKGEPVDVIDLDLRDVVKKIRGPKGTEVRLTILREAGEGNKTVRMVVPIIREEISLKDSAAESEIYYINNDKSKKIGYLKLPSFYYDKERSKSSASDVKEILQKFKSGGVKAVVLDLRGNPGGLLNEAIDIAGFFIAGGPVLQIVDGRNPPQIINDNDESMVYGGPLVLLVDKFSASASEILAGAVKDYHRGLIVGPDSTFGKGTVQSYNELPFKKGAIKITVSLFYQPGGTSNQLSGIEPDIKIPDISSIFDLGESKNRYALKWKKIESAQFLPFGMVNGKIIARLEKNSRARIMANEKFRNLMERIKKYKEQINNKTISLKEESAIEKQKQKELEKTFNKESGKKLIDLDNDIFLREVFNITGDYTTSAGQ